jgi:dTDP-4-dehydrorhamnose 3,5-epimerase
MKITKTKFPGLLVLEPKVFEDERGYFFESYRKSIFEQAGIEINILQENESVSMKNVLRGLHFQIPPFAQDKLVRVAKGSVLDVAMDIRRNSPTYGQWKAFELSAENRIQLWIPKGFAHGFKALEDHTIFQYKCTNIYNRESEGSIRWNDPDLNIDWGSGELILSEKDNEAPLFREFVSPF